ncbi:hypothetical protein [Rossellomorea aquimaris]|jgi:hypothetical protein|uniref:hypothetical protein n=1 Tax=Rossellomorea aquimaris TaxID=189382 RepID=UPI000B22F12D|nr:hypothetical protein [Rossellomorea aquimaris]
MIKDLLWGAAVFIIGLIIVVAFSSISSGHEQSFQLGLIVSILYLASIIFVSAKKK